MWWLCGTVFVVPVCHLDHIGLWGVVGFVSGCYVGPWFVVPVCHLALCVYIKIYRYESRVALLDPTVSVQDYCD